MKIKFLSLILGSFVLLSCGGQTNQSEITSTTIKDTSQIAIIPYDIKKHFWIYDQAQATDLSKEELVQVETIFQNIVAKYNIDMKKRIRKETNDSNEIENSELYIVPDTYKRQYLPVITQDGEKEVWVNCFCKNFGDSWKHNVIQVFDGGKCYFNVKINLKYGTAYHFKVNGSS
ncbi:MAG: hypothetical protein H3C31_10905 [Brumimicrobium sp.]|nr:hypothetical protein [Brumimicrobium sp.]MCO5267308.1 hypothetical protein [Brumimicrobium sp.]